MFYDNVNKLALTDHLIQGYLTAITPKPAELFYVGNDPLIWLDQPKVAIVGSRKATAYGRAVTERLAGELAANGVVVISGLAIGIDTIAHSTALEAGGITAAVLPTPLNRIHPAGNLNLARQICDKGTILSEYKAADTVMRHNFIARNRLVCGIADVLLITEAALLSGTMHTARFALEQGKTVMAVPGNITSPASEGTNNLVKSGAIPATSSGDVMFALGLKSKPKARIERQSFSPIENQLFELISSGVEDQEELALSTSIDPAQMTSALTVLELGGAIRAQGGGRWSAQ